MTYKESGLDIKLQNFIDCEWFICVLYWGCTFLIEQDLSLKCCMFANIVVSRRYWYHVRKVRFNTDSMSLPQSIQNSYIWYLHFKIGWIVFGFYRSVFSFDEWIALVELLEYCMVTESIGGIWKCKLMQY